MSKSITENLLNTTDSYCPAMFGYLCWPQTPANQSVNISCAVVRHPGVDPSKYFTRFCLPSGNWSGFSLASCFYPDIMALLQKSYTRRSVEEREVFEKIIRVLRIVELAGLSISLTSILISLFIFFTFKSLYCSRTKIHINLLIAILIQIIARLVTYGIQMEQLKNSPKNECDINGSIPFHSKFSLFDGMCPLFIILLQFGITAMFMWMLCEGIHLNTVLTVNVFKNYFKTYYFHILGWAVPFCLTLSWCIVMFVKERHRKCFNNYNHLKYYWIIDGPRYAVMIINIIFLLNIIRILLVKIKEGSEKHVREEKQILYTKNLFSRLKSRIHRKRRTSMNAKFVRKAVKAAIFLLPLLGITHFLETFISPDDYSIPIFTIYCSVNVVLMTLQGFFCSLLYCFLNNEVRDTISRRFQTTQIWYRWKQYCGRKDRYGNGTITGGNRTRFDSQTRDSFASKRTPIELEERRLTPTHDDLN